MNIEMECYEHYVQVSFMIGNSSHYFCHIYMFCVFENTSYLSSLLRLKLICPLSNSVKGSWTFQKKY